LEKGHCGKITSFDHEISDIAVHPENPYIIVCFTNAHYKRIHFNRDLNITKIENGNFATKCCISPVGSLYCDFYDRRVYLYDTSDFRLLSSNTITDKLQDENVVNMKFSSRSDKVIIKLKIGGLRLLRIHKDKIVYDSTNLYDKEISKNSFDMRNYFAMANINNTLIIYKDLIEKIQLTYVGDNDKTDNKSPSLSPQCIQFDKYNDDVIYLGYQTGIYKYFIKTHQMGKIHEPLLTDGKPSNLTNIVVHEKYLIAIYTTGIHIFGKI
jgi:hypothetical protein